jgi:large subunit ribosomal protein L15
MQLHDLAPAPGSTKKRKRVGRGNASGHGTTAGRGDKGQKSRAGGGKGPGFEGGQNPLAMRLPKLPGFKNRWRQEYEIINVSRLEELYSKGDVVDADSLAAKGAIKSASLPVKVLGNGEITKSLTIRVEKISGSAKTKIEAAGGTVELT